METNKIVFRKMVLSDLSDVVKLEAACFTQPWTEQSFKESLEIPNVIYIVAIDDDTLVGNCGLRNAAGDGEITNVAIREDYRGKGIGTSMLNELLRIGYDMGVIDFTLEVRSKNIAAISLYNKCGFISEGVRPHFYKKPEDDAMIMWKRQVKACK